MFPLLISTLLLPPAPPLLPPQRNPGLPPVVLTAKVVKDQLILFRTQQKLVPQNRVIKVTNAGETREVTVTQMVTVEEKTKRAIDLTKLTMTDAEGNPIDLPALRRGLEKERVILMSSDGQPVDEAYRKLFKKDVIVIVEKVDPIKGFPMKKP